MSHAHKLQKFSFRVHVTTLKTPPSKQNPSHLDLVRDRDRDLDLEWREPSFDCAGERLLDFAEPRGDTLLKPGESWTEQILR